MRIFDILVINFPHSLAKFMGVWGGVSPLGKFFYQNNGFYPNLV